MQCEKYRAYQRVGFDVCFNSLIEEKKGRKENGRGGGGRVKKWKTITVVPRKKDNGQWKIYGK